MFLVGCDDVGKLNTSKLIVIEEINNEHGEVSLIEYEAPSVKDGLKALPFKMKLPKELPNQEMEFLPPTIHEYVEEGVIVQFDTDRIELEENIYMFISIKASYFGGGAWYPNAHYREVELKDGVVGRLYNFDQVLFEVDDVAYSVYYHRPLLPTEDHTKLPEIVIDLANQIF